MLTWSIYNDWYKLYKYFNRIIVFKTIKSSDSLNSIDSLDSVDSINKYDTLLYHDDVICDNTELYKLLDMLSKKNIRKYVSLLSYYRYYNTQENTIINLNSVSPKNDNQDLINFKIKDMYEYTEYYDEYEEFDSQQSEKNSVYFDLKDDLYDIYGKSPTEFKDNIENYEYFNKLEDDIYSSQDDEDYGFDDAYEELEIF